MVIIDKSFYTVVFTDSSVALSAIDTLHRRQSSVFDQLVKDIGAQHVVVLDQVHKTEGINIGQIDRSVWFEYRADYMITNHARIALTILTADCLPVVIVDPVGKVVNAVHAGWKGLIGKVVSLSIAEMVRLYGSCRSDLIIYVGPFARDCCYQVRQDFVDKCLENSKNYQNFFIQKEDKIFCDLAAFLIYELGLIGVDSKQIDMTNALCTICNQVYCSYRRDNVNAARQATMIALR